MLWMSQQRPRSAEEPGRRNGKWKAMALIVLDAACEGHPQYCMWFLVVEVARILYCKFWLWCPNPSANMALWRWIADRKEGMTGRTP